MPWKSKVILSPKILVKYIRNEYLRCLPIPFKIKSAIKGVTKDVLEDIRKERYLFIPKKQEGKDISNRNKQINKKNTHIIKIF